MKKIIILLTLIAVIIFIRKSFGIRIIEIPEKDQTLNILEDRARAQLKNADHLKVFYDFWFEDKNDQTGITFKHKVVDDAGKSYKAVHYDHGNGLAAADVNGDQLIDLYFITQIGSNELYVNNGDGTFSNITSRSGVGVSDKVSVSAAFADIDNDGDQDLYVTTVNMGNMMFENDGNGTFADITSPSGLQFEGHSSGASFFDYDNDGLIDLMVTNVGRYTGDLVGPGGYLVGYSDAFNGHLYTGTDDRTEMTRLYKNLGDKRFKDVTQEIGFFDVSWSGDFSFADLNQDGFLDLYVLNMQGDDHYYENNSGMGFVDKTSQFFPKTPWGSMGIKFFDYDNDQKIDLLITDMHSDMSYDPPHQEEKVKAKITYDDDFLMDGDNNIFGNAFYPEAGNLVLETSDELGLENLWPWGPSVADLNADTFQDVFIASGMNYPFRYGVNSLLLNNRGEGFFDSEFILKVEPRINNGLDQEWFRVNCLLTNNRICQGYKGIISVKGALGTRSAVIFDVENDGDLDIITNEFNNSPQVLISNLSEKKSVNFVKVALKGNLSNANGVGAKVTAYSGNSRLTQFHDGKSGYLSQSQIPLYFGLGESRKIDKIEVIWPSGIKQEILEDIPINSLIVIEEIGEE
jgi:hypothetical protein